VSTAHEQWMAAWAATELVTDDRRREELRERLGTVSGELRIGPQAGEGVRRRSLGVIREVRQEAERFS
jgi:hypothetical protein